MGGIDYAAIEARVIGQMLGGLFSDIYGAQTGRLTPERKEDNKMDLKEAYTFKTAPDDIDLARVVKEAPPEAMIVTVDWKAPGDEYPHVVALGTKRFRDACRKAGMSIPGYLGELNRDGRIARTKFVWRVLVPLIELVKESVINESGAVHVVVCSNVHPFSHHSVTHVINRVKAVMAELKRAQKSVVVSVCHVTEDK